MAQGELSFFDRDPAEGEKTQPGPIGKKTPSERPSTIVPEKPQPPAVRILTVTQLTRLIKLTLNAQLPEKITLEGEISNFKRHSSGHLYFTLKDENAQIPAVMWKSDAARLKFSPADGLAVIASGRVDVFERDGKYQFYVDKIQPAGAGALELAFRQLAEKLRKEGLFDEKQKKPIPAFPTTIAIVTSSTGAAIQDIEKTLHRRCPIVRKLLYAVPVQGEGSAGKIAEAIYELNRRREQLGGVDVIILARGGGSIEDLWAFNEEIVARAIFDSRIPIITGVGHESDVTIADLAADCRAATPTAAAEQAVPVLAEMKIQVAALSRRLLQQASRQLEAADARLSNLTNRPLFARPADMIRHLQQQLDEQQETLRRRIIEILRRCERTLDRCGQVLRRIEPDRFLGACRNHLLEHKHRLDSASLKVLRRRQGELEQKLTRLQASGPARQVPPLRITVVGLVDRLANAQRRLGARRQETLTHLNRRLASINPRAILARGYSITRLGATGQILTPDVAVQTGDLLHTELADDMLLQSQAIAPPEKKGHKT